MNKLLVPNGGMPLFGDDFAFLDAATRDAFKGVFFAFGGNMVLGGCELTIVGDDVTVSPGYVLIDYEVCYFPGRTFSSTLAQGGNFAADNYFDPAGEKVFADASSHNTYQVRRAKFNATNTVVGGPLDLNSLDLVRFPRAIQAALIGQVSSSNAISYANSWAAESGNAPVLQRLLNRCELYGGLVPGTLLPSSFTLIAHLPAGYRPVRRFKAICAAVGTGLYGSIMVEIFPDGSVYAIAVDGNSYELISLNISYVV
jgi:hypothetical protein